MMLKTVKTQILNLQLKLWWEQLNIQVEKKNNYTIGNSNEDLTITHIDKAIKLFKKLLYFQ